VIGLFGRVRWNGILRKGVMDDLPLTTIGQFHCRAAASVANLKTLFVRQKLFLLMSIPFRPHLTPTACSCSSPRNN